MSPSQTDRLVGRFLGSLAWCSAGITLLIVVWVGVRAFPAFQDPGVAPLFSDERWLPGSEREPQFGMVPILVGSVLVTLVALLPAVLVGVLCAIFQQFYAPAWFSGVLRKVLELLAGIPSVVIGFWGLVVVVPLIQKFQSPGQSLLAAGVVLALMILPTIAITAQSALQGLPKTLYAGAAALGVARPRMILQLALPAARSGIVAGVVLGAARAIGETMAVIMVCGNIPEIPSSLFDPVRPITATIALEMGYATEGHRGVLFAAGFILVLFVGALAAWVAFSQKGGEE